VGSGARPPEAEDAEQPLAGDLTAQEELDAATAEASALREVNEKLQKLLGFDVAWWFLQHRKSCS
jgi:hypothetical protein